MEKNRLGNSGLQITKLGLGAWAIGGSWAWGWAGRKTRYPLRPFTKPWIAELTGLIPHRFTALGIRKKLWPKR